MIDISDHRPQRYYVLVFYEADIEINGMKDKQTLQMAESCDMGRDENTRYMTVLK
jgi:hypothetical protein